MSARHLIALAVAAMLAGCAATGAIDQKTPVSVAMAEHSVARLDVRCEEPDEEDAARLVQAKLAARLKRAGVFEQLVTPDTELAEPTLELRVDVTIKHGVSTTARAWVGALAGQAGVELDVELIRLDDGESVGSMVAVGKSSGGTAFAGTTTQAIEQAVDQVVAELAKHR